MKNVFGVITCRLDIAEESISKFESRSIDTSQIKMKKEKQRTVHIRSVRQF